MKSKFLPLDIVKCKFCKQRLLLEKVHEPILALEVFGDLCCDDAKYSKTRFLVAGMRYITEVEHYSYSRLEQRIMMLLFRVRDRHEFEQ